MLSVGDTLAQRKDAVVVGTYESSAFILSLRRREECATTHSFGYHRVPHIGVYGSDYTLTAPLALLSLPASPRYLQKLPQDILNALDLGHLTGTLTSPPPPSPRHLLSQHLITHLHSNWTHSRDQQLRDIARELVKFVIASAVMKLGLLPSGNSSNVKELPYTSVQLGLPQCDDPRLKVPSVVSMGSIDEREEEKEEEKEERVAVRSPRMVSFQVQSEVIQEAEFEEEWSEEEEEEEEGEEEEKEEEMGDGEDSVKVSAKKIVKKALHLACKRWESLHRRSSIDYLIANTKRLKIASPSPPLTLPEENEEKTEYEDGMAAGLCARTGWDTPSPIPDITATGKKRNRSESHDIMMMRELEMFRRAQLGQEVDERVFAKPRRRGSKREGIQPQEPIGELIDDIHHLSLQKEDPELEDCCSSEENYTILSGVTTSATARTSSDSDASSPVPPPNSPTSSLQVVRGGVNRSPSPLLHAVLPSALQQISHRSSLSSEEEEEEEKATCTSLEFQQKLLTLQPSVCNIITTPTDSREPLLMLARDSPVPEMDYYILVHTYPPPGLCQKFLCGNTNEVNLLYHCWLYPEVPCDSDIICSEQLAMGVFHPRGVAPVHQDLNDAGVAFHHLQPRTVCIHNCCFSPENAQLQLLPGHQVHTFFSAARFGARSVVTLHVVPGASEVEDALREEFGKCSLLHELLEHLALITPSTTDIIKNLILL